MDEVAHAEGVENKRVCPTLGHPQAHSVAPHKAERVSQEKAKRTGRLGPSKNSQQQRMIGAYQPVMRRDLLAVPVAPAGRCTDRLRLGGEVLRSSHQPVGLAESVGRDCVAANVGLFTMSAE